MGDRKEAARGHGVAEPGHGPGRVVLVGEEVQDGHQQQRQRLVEVDEVPHLGMVEDRVGLAQVRQDDGRAAAGEERVGVHVDDRVVVDVGHARVWAEARMIHSTASPMAVTTTVTSGSIARIPPTWFVPGSWTPGLLAR